MPNYVRNIVRFKGSQERIDELLEAVKLDNKQDDNSYAGKGTIDFRKVVPIPDYVYQGPLGDEEKRLYGNRNWYDWNMKHWGTKWNAYNPLEPVDNEIRFETAWNAPMKVIEELSFMFNDLEITIDYADEDIGFNCGRTTFKNGEKTREWALWNAVEFANEMWEIS